MKPKSYVLMVMILLVGVSMVGGALAVRAQSSADAPAGASGNYLLPLVMGSSFDIPTATPTPSPTPTPNATPAQATTTKAKSGIHMGNRGSDWNPAFFNRIGYTTAGAWPAAVVVQSNQLFDYVREADEKCRISSASVKQVDGKEYELYRYLTTAIITHTVKVVIRISPSPGNFNDYDNPGSNHSLRTDETPAGGDYCDPNNAHKFRDILDLAQEMAALYELNVNRRGWPAASLFFEPANEPNVEWYAEKSPVDPDVFNKQAWIDMDNYFAALYDKGKELQSNLQILAPAMAQGARGEHFFPGTCDNSNMTVTDANGRTGLDMMKTVYGYDLWTDSYTTPKADGFAWHNYWQEGQEGWEPTVGVVPTLDTICPGNESYEPRSDHIYQYLSGGMQASIGGHPTFITEADLQSPCQNGENPIGSKEQLPDGSNYAYRTRDSLRTFINQEFGASYVIAWLLVNEYSNEAQVCRDENNKLNANFEINWHEAYLESGSEREWFALWWPEAQ